jgi:hypothetical protein
MALAEVIDPCWAALLRARVGLLVFANVNKYSGALQIMIMDRSRGRSRDGEAQIPTTQTRLRASSSQTVPRYLGNAYDVLHRAKVLRFLEAIESLVACYMAAQAMIVDE